MILLCISMMQLQKEEDGTKVVNGFYEMTSAMTQEEIDALLEETDEEDKNLLFEKIVTNSAPTANIIQDVAILLNGLLGHNDLTILKKQDEKKGYLIANRHFIKVSLQAIYYYNRYILRYAYQLKKTFVVFTAKNKRAVFKHQAYQNIGINCLDEM